MSQKRETKKKAANSTVSVSLRIDPRTKYLVDLLARDQKRTITGVIEWAIERSASQYGFENGGFGQEPSFLERLDHLWSTDEALRVVRLAIDRPDLLDYDELRTWETIKATQAFLRVGLSYTSNPLAEGDLFMDKIQEHWDALVEHVGKHQNSRSIVPYPLDMPEGEYEIHDIFNHVPF